jgi:hypothetical protein
MPEILANDDCGQQVLDGFVHLAQTSLAVSWQETAILNDLRVTIEDEGITDSNLDSVDNNTLTGVGFDMLSQSLDLRDRVAEYKEAQRALAQRLFELEGRVATVTALGGYSIIRSYAPTKPSEAMIENKTRVHSAVRAPLLYPSPGSLGDLSLLLRAPTWLPRKTRRISAPIVNKQTITPLVTINFSR